MLHTVNKSPFATSRLEDCLRFVENGDSILLYEDGVFGAMAGSKVEAAVKGVMQKASVYALSADVKARGLTKLIDGVKTVDYAGFVDLTAADKVNNW